MESLERAFAEHRAALIRYATRLTGDPDVAEDVVQETFVRLMERPPEETDGVRGWLFVVATNLVRDARRTAGRRAKLLRRWSAPDPGVSRVADPHAALERAERARRVRDALSALSMRDRTVLLMREEGFTHREIAEAAGTTTKSVGTIVARALDKLAGLLDLDEEGS